MIYPFNFNYHFEAKEIVRRKAAGELTFTDAFRLLEWVENRAYELDPQAEPDGDITYVVAVAASEIREADFEGYKKHFKIKD